MTDFALTRTLFDIPEGMIYLDGNSLGPLPIAAKARVADMLADEASTSIKGWNVSGWINLSRSIGDPRRQVDRRARGHHDHGRHAVDQGLPGAGRRARPQPGPKVVLRTAAIFHPTSISRRGWIGSLDAGWN